VGKRGSAAAPDPYYSSRLIHASGPADSPGLLVGEAGGETEHRRQRPFSGKAGHVLDTYLRAAGIARPDVRVTNVFPAWTGPSNPEPTAEQIAAEEWRLVEEIATNKPRVIGAIGRIATQWFLGPNVSIEQTNGIPHWSDRAPGAIILPVVHPAAGFYNPALASLSQEGFFRFAHYLRNPMPPRETPVIEVREVVDEPPYLEGAIDTEGMPNRPWGCSWSKDGKVTNVHISSKLTNTTIRGRVTFQNALHDLVVLRAMGVDTSTLDYDDTMVMLYDLQLEPQGLKPAAYRHLNLRMQDFDDVVRPHFNDVALDYFRQAMSHRYPKPRPYIEADWKARKWKLKKPWDAGRRIKAVLKSWDKDPVETKLEKKWADLGDEMQEQVQCTMKEDFPEFSIFEVPRAQAVQYSGIDAAATALLKPVLLAQLEAKGLLGVYEMDRRYLPFVDKMQETGMRVEVPRLKELEGHLEGIREAAKDKVQRIVGDRWFNPGSDDQVGRWLYKVQGLPILKYTEGGDGSTSAVTMKMIQGYYGRDRPEVMEFTKGIREYRESDKYLGTFVLPIFYYMKRDKWGTGGCTPASRSRGW
jgi:uracil-DNA glycosylase family 4